MNRTRKRRLPALLSLVLAGPAFAHQPRLVYDRPTIEVREPGVSQAFYARLAGHPQTYTIRTQTPLRFYVDILVPDVPQIGTDYEAVISRNEDSGDCVLARLDGRNYAWRPFYEPFGGDHDKLGPEYDENVPAGAYTVVVSSPDNRGKYVLAVGKIEKFPPNEMVRTIFALPKLKKYFGKSPLTAFFNLSGAFLLAVVAGMGGLTTLFF